MFINASTHTFTVPGSTELVTVRKLTRKQLRKAAQERAIASIGVVRDLGGAAVLKEIQSLEDGRHVDVQPAIGTAQAEPDEAAKRELALDAAMASYDEDTVLALGVVGFNPQPIDVKINDLLDRLEEGPAKFIAREVIAFCRGERGDTAAEKNG